MTIPSRTTLLILSLTAALTVATLAGCGGGSSSTPVAVTGQVLLLQDDGTPAGKEGVTLTLTQGSRVYQGVTDATGTYTIADVLAPVTYQVGISGNGVTTSKLSALRVTVPAGGASVPFAAPTVYVTPDVPAPPAAF